MNNVTSIFKSKDKTKPEHDTMRQISRSETPSVEFWHHQCETLDMVLTGADDVKVLKGQTCTICFKCEDDFKKSKSLNEAIKHIMGPQPVYWQHNCEEYQGKRRQLEVGQICPVCFVTQDGVFHLPGGVI